MEQKTLYTAIGRLERETNGCGRSCPVIRLGGQPYMVDMQELVVWTALNWRISKWEDISFQCDRLASSMGGAVSRPWDACVNRLLMKRSSRSAPMPYINFTMIFGKNFWLEAFHAGKKAANSSKKSLTTAMSAIWTANTVRTIFRLRWNSGRCRFPLHFAAARQNCTAQNACGMISGSILRTVTIFKSSLTHRKKHYCVLPICRSGSPTSWNTAAPTVRLTGRRCPMWHALC